MEVINSVIDRFNRSDRFSKNRGIRLVHLEDGMAKAVLDAREEHCNYMGSVHGGVLSTLADITAGMCITYYGNTCVTLNSNIHYVHPAFPGRLTATAVQRSLTRHTGLCDVSIRDENDVLICTATLTMYITSKPVEL